ncbi:MAG: GNAT family N-acetyltransferase [Lautropia sp.]
MSSASDTAEPFDSSRCPIAAAEPADADAITRLLRGCGLPQAAAAAAAGAADAGEPRPAGAAAPLIARSPDGEVIGCAVFERIGETLVLDAIAVAPKVRRRGIGARLLRRLLANCVAAGVQRVALVGAGHQEFFGCFGFATAQRSAFAPEIAVRLRGDADPAFGGPMELDLRSAALVRPATRDDMPAVVAIYNDAVAQSTATYDYEPRALDEQYALFDQRHRDGFGFFVAATPDGTIAGFSTYGMFRTRPGWRFAVEHSVYVAAPWRGRRVGLALLPPIMQHARGRGFHSMVGVVDADNAASLRMHQRVGFVPIGTFREGGYKFDRWLDVVFVQALL